MYQKERMAMIERAFRGVKDGLECSFYYEKGNYFQIPMVIYRYDKNM